MIVKTLDEIINTENDVRAETWASRRFLLKKDGMGFSFHETIIYAGTETHIWYKNHLEAVYCVGGEGEIETIADGKIYPIKDGTMYALNEHDEHYLRAKTDLRLICVFNPPLTGQEVHDKDGVYPLLED
ncbi:ectoine synthase [Pueribacillus sp. YX66]|uniref:ectoine synthase n=1 Tax=Pueribacillus sp. YX66 TaxID=3229242 RepID=UPI00358D91E0